MVIILLLSNPGHFWAWQLCRHNCKPGCWIRIIIQSLKRYKQGGSIITIIFLDFINITLTSMWTINCYRVWVGTATLEAERSTGIFRHGISKLWIINLLRTDGGRNCRRGNGNRRKWVYSRISFTPLFIHSFVIIYWALCEALRF